MTSKPISALLDLHGLAASRSREMRPMLARVLTDLFVQAPALHAPADVEQFGTLIESFYEDLDRAVRVVIAEKLAERSDAPPRLIRRLALEDLEIAGPLLDRAALPESLLIDLLRTADAQKRAAIARRPGLGRALVHHLSQDRDPVVLRALLGNGSAHLSEADLGALAARVATERDLASALVRRPEACAADLAHLFITADREARAVILDAFIEAGAAAFELRLPGKAWLAAATSADLGALLVEHAKGGRTTELAEVLRQFLSLPLETAEAILRDDGGEPLVVALKALRVEDKELLTLLLLANPVIGLSVERVYALVALAKTLSTSAADRLIATWRDGEEAAEETEAYEETVEQVEVERSRPSRPLPAALRRGGANERSETWDEPRRLIA